MGDFYPHIEANCDGGSLVTVDLTAPYNIFKVEVTVNGTTFTVEHKVHFDKVPGPWWLINSAVNTQIDGTTATVTAVFYEIDKEGHVFRHEGKTKTVVALPATDCAEVTTTTAARQATTTTTAGLVPPPAPPTTVTTATVVHHPHQVHQLPATGLDPAPLGLGCLLIAAGIGLLVKGSRIGNHGN